MDDEANRCWCGSTLKGKPHNCVGTRGRVEGLLAEIAKLKILLADTEKRCDLYAQHLKSCVVWIAPEIPCDCGFLSAKSEKPKNEQPCTCTDCRCCCVVHPKVAIPEKPSCDHKWEPYALGTDLICHKCKRLTRPPGDRHVEKWKCQVKSQAGFPCSLAPGHEGAHQVIVGWNS